MDQKKQKRNENNTVSSEVLAAKLAFIGSAIATFGDALSSLAALIELEEIVSSEREKLNQQDQTQQLQMMQIQIDQLTAEIAEIKDSMK